MTNLDLSNPEKSDSVRLCVIETSVLWSTIRYTSTLFYTVSKEKFTLVHHSVRVLK